MTGISVPFGDLQRQHTQLRQELEVAMTQVLLHGWYILGKEVRAFEQEFAHYCGVAHAVGVANGTDALYLALAALKIGPGDEVITVANAGSYQVMAILQTGARPVLVDSDPNTHTLDPHQLEPAITPRTRAILPVHLYGRLADMPAIAAIATRHGLDVVEDAAQAHGAWMAEASGHPRKAGAWGICAAFSFYPTKNLGAIGDGGAVVTDDAALAEQVRQLRQYGWSSKYVTTEPGGRNSRLDELQAALLRIKLRYLDAGNAARRERAAWYAELLADTPLNLPDAAPGHVYHLYAVESEQRDALRSHLTAAGIGSDIHYPLPAHCQPAYAHLNCPVGTLPQTERQARRILSLPLFPELTCTEVEQVAATVQAWTSETLT
jgi:dTDP-4-amino-4,6-dideoxygalactose transaminase